MRLRMAQHRAPGRRQVRERERIRRRAGRHQKYRDLALEDLGEALLDPPGPVVVAVAERVAGIGLADRLEDFGRRDSGRVVACEVHAFPRHGRLSRLEQCNSVALRLSIHVPLVTCREAYGATNRRRRRWIWRAPLLPWVAGFRHIRTVLLSQLAAALRRPAAAQTAERSREGPASGSQSRPSREGLEICDRGVMPRTRKVRRTAKACSNNGEDDEHATVRQGGSEHASPAERTVKDSAPAFPLWPGVPEQHGLYDPRLDKDSCGVGFIADIKGRKSHKIVEDAIDILCNLEHRGAVGADPRAGDGAGILVQTPHKFFAAQGRRARHHAARARPLRGRLRVHAARPGMAEGDPRHLRREGAAGRPDAARLARGAARQFLARRIGEADRAVPHAGVHRRAGPRSPAEDEFERRLYILRKVISDVVYRTRERRLAELLRRVAVVPHRDLQGHVPRRPARQVLSRPARAGFRDRALPGASALLHQHVPELAAGAPLPHGGAQWRDQHAARQRQLDGGAAGLGLVEAVRRRHHQALADLLRGPVRHRLLRQRARIPDPGRLLARACRHDADPGSLGRQSADG